MPAQDNGGTPPIVPPSVTRDRGASLIEVLIVLVIVAVMAGMTVPLTATALDANRARQGAAFLAARLRFARVDAVFRAAAVAIAFDQVAGRWTARVCVDGNGNGVRRAEIAAIDQCVDGPYDVESMFPGARVAVDASIRGPDGEPGSSDAVRFGRSDLASCSPTGGCTAGSVFVRSSKGDQYVVRVASVAGRTRVLHYDRVARVWREI